MSVCVRACVRVCVCVCVCARVCVYVRAYATCSREAALYSRSFLVIQTNVQPACRLAPQYHRSNGS